MAELYWIGVLGNINALALVVFCLSAFALLLFLLLKVIGFLTDDDDFKNMNPIIIKTSFIVVLISALFSIFIPSSKQLYTIVGVGTVIDYVQENKDLQQIPDKTVKVLDMWIDKQLEEND